MATLLETYRLNEERNEHTKNALLLAVAFGDGQEQDEGERHVKFLRWKGYQTSAGTEFQSRMSQKYFHRLQAYHG
jgi:hypothetical protein